jgi:signal transduction histidine kinase
MVQPTPPVTPGCPVASGLFPLTELRSHSWGSVGTAWPRSTGFSRLPCSLPPSCKPLLMVDGGFRSLSARLRPTLLLMTLLLAPHLVMYRLAVPQRSFAAAGATVLMVFATAVAGLVARREIERGERLVEAKRVEQRTALARDVHDTIAHHLSAIALQADAAALLVRSDPGRAETLLGQIHRNAQSSLDEIRSVIGMLRVDTYEAAPGVTDLGHLVSSDGPRVVVQLAPGVEHLPLHVSTAIYRIGQEAVANARRHARGARQISVAVEQPISGGIAVLEVRDDGQPGAARRRNGWGIVGMTERAALLGGSVAAGPDARGGWTVRAELPVSPGHLPGYRIAERQP